MGVAGVALTAAGGAGTGGTTGGGAGATEAAATGTMAVGRVVGAGGASAAAGAGVPLPVPMPAGLPSTSKPSRRARPTMVFSGDGDHQVQLARGGDLAQIVEVIQLAQRPGILRQAQQEMGAARHGVQLVQQLRGCFARANVYLHHSRLSHRFLLVPQRMN